MRETVCDAKIGPECFINRELSWLEFNLRVLEEAENPDNPLMERLKFLAIFSSNLDEFFMVRVAGVREQAFGESAPQDFSPDGLSALEQLKAIAKRTQELVARQYRCLKESIGPAMAAEGFELLRYDTLEGPRREHVDRFFQERALPILTPMAVDPAHPSPRYHNRGLYLGAMLEHAEGLGPKQMFAVVQVPQVLPRIIGVKDATGKIERVSMQRATCGKDFIQLSGEDATALGFNAHGGVGCISVTANVAPKLCAEFQAATLAGDYRKALEYQDRLMPLHEAIFLEPGLAGAKYGLSLLGRCTEEVRLPLVGLTDGTKARIKAAMEHAGLL